MSEPVVLRVSELPLVAILNVKTNASANQSKETSLLNGTGGYSGDAPNELRDDEIPKERKFRDFDEEDFDERKRRRNFKAKRGIGATHAFLHLFFTTP